MRGKPVLVGLMAALALASSLAVTAVVLGHTKKTVVRDQRNPNVAAECDIREATAQVVRRGRRARHAVTVRGRIPDQASAPGVWMFERRGGEGDFERAWMLVDPDNPKVEYHFTDARRTIVYVVKRRDLPAAFRNHHKYFWFTSGCGSDDAPNQGRKRQAVVKHDHR